MDLQLAGKVALVTGSSRGTGAGIARVLAREGAHVVVSGADEIACERIAGEIAKTGGKASIAPGDVASAEGAEAVIAALVAARLEVDVLVNNYGTAERGFWSTATDADWLSIYEKNVVSGVRLVRALVPAMKARGHGRIVFVGTIGSTRPNARMPHYYAAKGALPVMTVGLAKELAGTGITVNLVSPGLIATAEVIENARRRAAKENWPEIDDPEALLRRLAAHDMPNPVGRIATTEEVGELVAFLAGSRAAFINGQNIRIDGGAVDVTV